MQPLQWTITDARNPKGVFPRSLERWPSLRPIHLPFFTSHTSNQPFI